MTDVAELRWLAEGAVNGTIPGARLLLHGKLDPVTVLALLDVVDAAEDWWLDRIGEDGTERSLMAALGRLDARAEIA